MIYRQTDQGAINYIQLGKRLLAKVGDTAAVDTAGDSRQNYHAFGETVEAPKDDVGYTGHKFDTELDLSYMQQRYYDPMIGRFYSNDPADMMEHIARGNPVHGFNRYTYANNNPHKYVDPDGEFGILGAIAGAAIEVGFQVVTSIAKGKSVSESVSNLNLGKVAAAAALGSVGGVGTGLLTAAARGKVAAGNVSLVLSSKAERAIVGVNGAMIAGTSGAATAGMRDADMTNGGVAKIVDGLTSPFYVGSVVNGVNTALENPEAVGKAIDKAKEVIDKMKE